MKLEMVGCSDCHKHFFVDSDDTPPEYCPHCGGKDTTYYTYTLNAEFVEGE